MEVVKHAAVPAVTQVVVPAKPETFDLKGLTETDMALLLIALGMRAGTYAVPSHLYDVVLDALGIQDYNAGEVQGLMKADAVHVYSYTVKPADIEHVLKQRPKPE